jgi:hypothetical protein
VAPTSRDPEAPPADRQIDDLPAVPPGPPADSAERSVGTAFGAAAELDASGQSGLARELHDAAATAFFDGFQIAILVAAAIALAGAVPPHRRDSVSVHPDSGDGGDDV